MAAAEQHLIEGYTLRVLDREEFEPLFRQHRPRVFAEKLEFDPRPAFSADESAALDTLFDRLDSLYRLQVGIYHQGEFVGWSFGVQEGVERFYMVNSGVLPEHQNKGIYSALLPRLLEMLKREGFQVVYSRHTATNHRILIPKLKAGFVITGFELSDRFGVVVHLSYVFSELRRRIFEVRAGERVPDEEIRRYLRLG